MIEDGIIPEGVRGDSASFIFGLVSQDYTPRFIFHVGLISPYVAGVIWSVGLWFDITKHGR